MNIKPCLFLDRDGTLIIEKSYLREPNKVQLEAGVVNGLLKFIEFNYRLVVVSNQSGVGRGLLTVEDVHNVNHRLTKILADYGISISSWHFCPHLPTDNCMCRKPNTEMFLKAAGICPVDWSRSVMVGDKRSDIEAGLSLGIFSALVTTGYGSDHITWASGQGICIVGSIEELSNVLLY